MKPHCIYRIPTSESRTLPAACESPSLAPNLRGWGLAFLVCAFRGANSVGSEACQTSDRTQDCKVYTARYWVSLRPVTGSNVLVAYFVTGAGRVMARLPEEEAVSRVLALLKLGYQCPVFFRHVLLAARPNPVAASIRIANLSNGCCKT